MIFLSIVALLSPFLANQRPLYMHYKGHHFFPAFSFKHQINLENETLNYDFTNFKTIQADFIIYAPIPWSPGKSDFQNSNVSPFDKQSFMTADGKITEMPFYLRHWLGTNNLGADVLSGIIHGFRYSFFIAGVAIFVASIIGIFLGALAGYFGNSKWKVKRISLLCFTIVFLYGAFYLMNPGNYELQQAAANGICFLSLYILSVIVISFLLFFILNYLLNNFKWKYLTKEITIPIDHIVSRSIEITMAMPRLILIITLAAIVRPSLFNLGIIIGVSLWTELARFARSQTLQLREMDYISAARAMGFSDLRIMIKHILINGMSPILVVICFSFSNVILTESGLSFLGVGVPRQVVTWGSMLSSARENLDAWWLTIFPGICILLTVLLFNRLADSYSFGNKIKFSAK